MTTIRTATFGGVRYDVDLCGPVDGLADNPKGGRPSLVLCVEDLYSKRGLATAIHEALHCCSFHTSEEKVTQTAEDLARFLWRLYEFKRRKP